MTWTEGDVTVDGARIHYYRRGRGTPLVLAHGASDNGKCWERVAAALEGEYDIVAYDARNHGLSDSLEGKLSGGGEDLVGVVEALELERPALMGHSMGAGAVAQAVKLQPRRFSCAILEDPAWREPGPLPQRPPGPDFRALSIDQIIAFGKTQSRSWHDAEFPAWAESKQQFRPPADIGAAFRGDWRDAARLMTIPTLLVCGGSAERGRIVNESVAQEAKTLAPSIEVVRFRDAGHNVRREAFEGFVAAVNEFLAKHATTDPARR